MDFDFWKKIVSEPSNNQRGVKEGMYQIDGVSEFPADPVDPGGRDSIVESCVVGLVHSV